LAQYCKKVSRLTACCEKALELNKLRQDFIHATFAADDRGGYVRFRELVAYTDLERDVSLISLITNDANALIVDIDKESERL
jgi:hypothetical protein